MEVSIGNFLLYRKERPIRKKLLGGSQGLPRRCGGRENAARGRPPQTEHPVLLTGCFYVTESYII